MTSATASFTLPPLLKKEVGAAPETGYYDNKSEFIRDAVRTLLASRKDLRMAMACVLYRNEEISLGKAAEMAEVSIEEMKKMLAARDVPLKRGVNIEEAKKRSDKAIKSAGR